MNRSASLRIVYAWIERIAANVNLTFDDALAMLGFKAGTIPSKEEIQRAYRQMARKYHPDLGGDAEKMVEVNVAKDILDGTRRPSSGGSSYSPPKPRYEPPKYEPPRYEQPKYEQPKYERPRYERPSAVVVTFAEALHDVSIPAGVKWIFITEQMRYSRDYMGDESSRYTKGYIALGQTDTQMVLLLMHHVSRSQSYIGGHDSNTWQCTVQTSSLKKGALDPTAAVKGIKGLMAQAELDKPANPTVIALDEQWTPSEKGLPGYGKGLKMSEFFVNMGLKKAPAAKDKPAGKLLIDVASPDKYSEGKYVEGPDEIGIFVGERYYGVDWTTISNKRYFWTIRSLLVKNNYSIKGYYRKSLTRMKMGKDIAKILLQLHELNKFEPKLPQDVVDALTAISEAA